MNKNRMIITEYKDKEIMALYSDSRLTNLFFQDDKSDVGSIYTGKVKNIVPNIDGAFIDIGTGVQTYYPIDEETPFFLNKKNNEKLVVGDEILVQIVKDGIKQKAPRCSSKLSLTGKYVVVSTEKGLLAISGKINDMGRREGLKALMDEVFLERFGVIFRTNCEAASDISIKAEISMLKEKLTEIIDNAPFRKPGQCVYSVPKGFIPDILGYLNDSLELIVTDIKSQYNAIKEYFEFYDESALKKLTFYDDDNMSLSSLYNLTKNIERATNKRVWLKSGGYLVIEQTEALVVIDVNTGKSIGKEETGKHFFDVNMEALYEACYQIRLRNLSGIIIIDFINMKSENDWTRLIETLKKELKVDGSRSNFVERTKLDLVEITRKKLKKSLKEQLE